MLRRIFHRMNSIAILGPLTKASSERWPRMLSQQDSCRTVPGRKRPFTFAAPVNATVTAGQTTTVEFVVETP